MQTHADPVARIAPLPASPPLGPVQKDPARRFIPAALSQLSPQDRSLFEAFGSGPDLAPRHRTLAEAFAAQVQARPQAIAAEEDGGRITYRDLNLAATRLAHLLHDSGVRPGDAVGLFLERSISMLIGMVACGKLGAAYVPQHLGVAPETALRHISRVTGAKVVLTLEAMAAEVPLEDGQVAIAIDGPGAGFKTTPLPNVARPEDTCMILFTSGTTGVPNGVRVTHRNLCNILLTAPGDLGIRPDLKVGQILSIAFDMAAWECWGALANGGTLVIRGKDIQQTAERVDVLIATPSILARLESSRCHGVQAVAVAGEPCPRPLADRWAAFCRFHNSCGPTETTIVNTVERHRPEKAQLTIGRPTPNNTVYVLDETLRPLPIGEKGEMWAGGDCVTAGYLANDALNAERYRPDPFLGGGRIMFRTRDLGSWTDTGELLHHGRVDDQVKIRGFRVELDGVSAALERAPGCTQAVTLKYDDRDLVAFVSPSTVDPKAATDHVRAALPYYCVPRLVVALDDLPRTPRGKLDKRLLMQIAADHLAAKEAAQ